jgi:hypothetical protein
VNRRHRRPSPPRRSRRPRPPTLRSRCPSPPPRRILRLPLTRRNRCPSPPPRRILRLPLTRRNRCPSPPQRRIPRPRPRSPRIRSRPTTSPIRYRRQPQVTSPTEHPATLMVQGQAGCEIRTSTVRSNRRATHPSSTKPVNPSPSRVDPRHRGQNRKSVRVRAGRVRHVRRPAHPMRSSWITHPGHAWTAMGAASAASRAALNWYRRRRHRSWSSPRRGSRTR